MTKSTEFDKSLAQNADPGHDRVVTPEKRTDLGEFDHGMWTWPPPVWDPDIQRIDFDDHITAFFMPPRMDVDADVVFAFSSDSIESRAKALVLSEELTARLQSSHPGARVEFYSASDHFHVIVRDFGSPEMKLAAGIIGTFQRGGLLRGGRSFEAEFAHDDEVFSGAHREFTFRRSSTRRRR